MSSSYPSYESLLTPDIASPNLLRLRSTLNSDNVSDFIFILDDPTDANSREEPYSSTHQICESASHCPLVSSIVVSIENLSADGFFDTYGHSQLKTGHPVRSAIHKQLNGRLVLRWVTTWESLLL
ncbi:hypothetical protein KCU67_g13933, partial [Aureobasidium melanogenum]